MMILHEYCVNLTAQSAGETLTIQGTGTLDFIRCTSICGLHSCAQSNRAANV